MANCRQRTAACTAVALAVATTAACGGNTKPQTSSHDGRSQQSLALRFVKALIAGDAQRALKLEGAYAISDQDSLPSFARKIRTEHFTIRRISSRGPERFRFLVVGPTLTSNGFVSHLRGHFDVTVHQGQIIDWSWRGSAREP
jgi:hypothetical protein